MSSIAYLEAANAVLKHLQDSQLDHIEEAAKLVVTAMENGGTINCSEIGHGIHWDFINRAGGLVAVQPFSFRVGVTNAVPKCRSPRQETDGLPFDLADVRYAVARSNLKAGDVMVVASVSGRNRAPIELAMACRDRGVRVIAFTAMAYTQHVKSLHPSGQRLFEVADVVIDNGAPYGDASVDVPGYDAKLIPVSGLGMLVSGWLIWGRVMELKAASGDAASILISHNRDGGPEHNEKSIARYQERGY